MKHAAFANCHSHVFHRALRGREVGGDTFWAWRDRMYAVAGVLDPDLLHALARATYAEMRLAGIGAVGEFHYVHHAPGGAPYADRHAMADALVDAARDVGMRLCLLDTCYLRAGFDDEPTSPVQRRFSDGTVDAWAERAQDLASRYAEAGAVVVGAAIHSVRAVPEDDLATVAAALPDAPLHVHVSEQPAENEACLAATGRTPVALLADAGVWSPRTTAVHATHLTPDDVATLGASGSTVCLCPTTEAELADGIGPSVALRGAGVRVTLGSDSNTVIDPFVEARAVEMHERLVSGRRGSWSAAELWRVATTDGYASLGFDPALAAGADAFALAPGSVRLAGATEPLWAATAADVVPPAELDPGRGAADLAAAIDAIWERV
ncbi:formimidoylglutamate deiminase [Luteimicrobium album]|uniref:Formimidoylglutamate deiminase n=1 Tax=Luteimicrobium album TaxID=1054550 RepID=A0ABQ6HYP1_9MICO|nr:formimidoylglutamate deiminase [Luteimicrobium album]GMA23620.1 formimidoylglutamate deiminase [Luteimicrobium album]